MSDYSEEVKAVLNPSAQADPAQSARVGYASAVGTNPDEFAKAQQAAQATGVPVNVAQDLPKEVKDRAAVNAINFDTLAKTSPATAGLLSDSDKAKISHDDVPNLQDVERTLVESVTDPIQRGYVQGKAGLITALHSMGLFGGVDSTGAAIRIKQGQREQDRYPVPNEIAAGMQAIHESPDFGSFLESALYNKRAVLETTLQSLGSSFPALATTAAGAIFGPKGTATGAGLGSWAVEYGNTLQDVMTEKGMDSNDVLSIHKALTDPEIMAAAKNKAILRSVPVAVFDALSGGLAGKLLKGAKATVPSVLGRVAGEAGMQMGFGAAGEADAELLTGEFKPGDIGMEAVAELPGGVVETVGNYQNTMEQAQRAETNTRIIEGLNNLSAASKVLERDPSTFENFVNHAGEGTPASHVYVDANALMQSGVADEVAALSPSVAAQLPVAAQTGGQIQIPVGEYAAHLATSEYAQSLMDHLKTGPNEFSRAEAADWMLHHADDLQAEIERSLGEAKNDDVFTQSTAALTERFRSELDALGHHTPEVNKAYSTLLGSYFAVNAAKLGITPEELHQRYEVKFASELQDGYSQDGSLQTATPAFKNWFNGSQVVDENGAPLVVYHGTQKAFNTFDGNKTMDGAFWFTQDKSAIDKGETGAAASGETIPVYLAAKKLAGWDEYEKYTHDQLIAQGYDGVKLDNDYIIFNPTQIKHATRNNGEFNPRDPNILRQKIPFSEAIKRVESGDIPGGAHGQTYNQSRSKGPKDPYTTDLFGNGIPGTGGSDKPTAKPGRRAAPPLSRDDVPTGDYGNKTELVQENTREIGINRVKTIEDAAQALAYLSKSAVERFDALITDKDGKPLAIVGAFKGALASATIPIPTLLFEAFRVNGAANIFFAHNHPSGNPTLSDEDKQLNVRLTEAFRGSGITPRGIFAIGGRYGTGRKWQHVDATSFSDGNWATDGSTKAPEGTAKVPVAERVLTEEGTVGLGLPIHNQEDAIDEARRASFGNAGVMVCDTQMRPVAFFHVKPDEIEDLREGGRMDAIYRALSMANGGSSFIVNHEMELTDSGIRNLAGLLNFAGAQVLDVIDFKRGSVEAWSSTQKSLDFKSKVFHQGAPDNNLMISHNLTEANLLHAVKMGGIAVPSLAVTKKENPLFGFGEITLLGDQRLADPKDYAKTKVFGSDIYSPRYPSVKYEFPSIEMRAARTRMADAEQATGQTFDWSELADNGARYLDDSPPLIYEFLTSKGIKPDVVMEKPPSLGTYFSPFAGDKRTDQEILEDPAFIQAVADFYNDAFRAEGIEGDVAQDSRGFAGMKRRELTNIRDYQRKEGRTSSVDYLETRRNLRAQIDELGLRSEMKTFAQNFIASLSPKERIFTGYNNAGDRKYIPHTLENVVKILKKDLRGGEGFNYGLGPVRSHFAPEFKTLKAIRDGKDRLVSEEQFDKIKQEVEDEAFQITSELSVYHPAGNSYQFTESVFQMLADVPKYGIPGALQENGFEDVPDDVMQKIAEFATQLRNMPTAYFEAKILREVSLAVFKGAVVPSDADPKVLQHLQDHGITDIRTYERGDNASRTAAISEFEHLFFQSKDVNRGSFNPSTLTISLLAQANLSTFLHESGHFFLEMQLDLASRLDALDYETLSPGEKKILKDANTLLEWFGVPDLNTWHNMSIDEKRGSHEKFARGFEAYLFEGNAPSIELQPLFQKFRAWLFQVYKAIKALNVELTPEVRGVFDRMLASEEQIRTTEQARSMMPLFATLDAAPMSPDEFEDYQALGQDATATALEDLESRALRDMKWLRNARSKVLKRLQREAKEQRREVRAGVRMEVLSMPVYRAWTLLTAKITRDDRLGKPPSHASDPNVVTPSQDSLFAAIAKLGGLNKKELMDTWDLDPAYKPYSGVFGKPVWRKEGGLSIDGMVEALAQYGYLPLDSYGRADIRDLEDAFDNELRGVKQYSNEAEYSPEQLAGSHVANPSALGAVRFDIGALREMNLPDTLIQRLQERKMTSKSGMHPDLVAGLIVDEHGSPEFSSGDELAITLANAQPPDTEIEDLTDMRMLENYGDLATPQAIERAADRAVHNDVRARLVATEANALAKATGGTKILSSAARVLAAATIARTKLRNLLPSQYTSAEVRAAKSAERYMRAKDLANAGAEKRNQLFNMLAARAALDAQDDIAKGLRYLKKFAGNIKGIDADYADQIAAILSRFDLRTLTKKEMDRRIKLADWLTAQEAEGLVPDLPPGITDELNHKPYKELTVEEFRGLVDSVKQIEHLGRLKKKLLLAKDRRDYEVIRGEIVDSINAHSQDRVANTRTINTWQGRAVQGLKAFVWGHAKVAMLARILDGGQDGGPVWEYFIRPANERGDWETTQRAEATAALSEILAPVMAQGKMGGSGRFFPTIGRSLNREACLAIALNRGNEGNLQRLLGGEGWTMQHITPVLQSLTAADLRAVQSIWDYFESYKSQIGAKERRIYGKEPDWIEPTPFVITSADGVSMTLRGGYYPIKYDPAASQRAEEHADAEAAKRQLQGAYTSATTRRSFTKARAEAVVGRPLLYSLSGVYSGINDVIHDLAWHEWLIDTNRLIKGVDHAVRSHYGPEVKKQFKTWAEAIAEGEKGATDALDLAASKLRQGVSASGLGFNLMSAAMQPTGFTQSVSRVGGRWIGLGINKYLSDPRGTTKQVNELSSFMQNRARTRFRELNELRNQVQDQSPYSEWVGRYAYFLMMRAQQLVDVPTWWGAYEKAQADGVDEERAIALADQAIIDSQGSGMLKDLAEVERGGPVKKLFTVFYSYMNTALNLGIEKTMSAEIGKRQAKLAADYLLIYVLPPVLGFALKESLTPSGGDDDDYLEKLPGRLAANQLDYVMGLMLVVREFAGAAKAATGLSDYVQDYHGPAGVRLIADAAELGKQVGQREFDTQFRKSLVNLVGDAFALPSAQVNRTWTGSEALAEGDTKNPLAIAFGFKH